MRPFAQCSSCEKIWETYLSFNDSINKKEVKFLGYQSISNSSFGDMFTHKKRNCKTTFIVVPNVLGNSDKGLRTV